LIPIDSFEKDGSLNSLLSFLKTKLSASTFQNKLIDSGYQQK